MAQAQSEIQPTRLPMIVQPENRNDDTLKDAKLINGFVEKTELTEEYHIYKRPGLEQTGSTLSGNGYGVYNWLGDIYSIFGSVLYKNGASVGTALDTTGGVYKFSQSLGATPRLQLGNGVGSYNYDTSAGLVAMTGANFPTSPVKGIAYLDGTTYVMDVTASIRGCTTINDPTVWTDVLNRISAQIEADNGVALAKQLVYVLALGQWSTEVFYDQQNATASPLGPVQGAKINYGCANANTVQEIDGALLWVATNRGAAAQVILLDNLKPTIVSTKAIERLLGEADLSSMYSFGIKYEGHRFYGITLVTKNITLVYDMTDKMWMQWTDANGNYWPIVSTTFSTSLGRILQHATNGKLYRFDVSYTTDDGVLFPVDIYTPNFDGQSKRRKALSMLEIVADQTEGSILQVRHNDHDYTQDKWTNFRSVNLNQRKPFLQSEGTFLRRAYHFRHFCNTRFRVKAVELQMDTGVL